MNLREIYDILALSTVMSVWCMGIVVVLTYTFRRKRNTWLWKIADSRIGPAAMVAALLTSVGCLLILPFI